MVTCDLFSSGCIAGLAELCEQPSGRLRGVALVRLAGLQNRQAAVVGREVEVTNDCLEISIAQKLRLAERRLWRKLIDRYMGSEG
jgi:hypothetical protein